MKKIKITQLEKNFLDALISLLYAEAGYSDVDVTDVAEKLNITKSQTKGILGSLVKKGLVEVEDGDFSGIIFLANCAYHLHLRWMNESNGFGVEQVQIETL